MPEFNVSKSWISIRQQKAELDFTKFHDMSGGHAGNIHDILNVVSV